MTDTQIPDTPTELRESGACLWRSVVDQNVLDEHVSTLLLQASRTVDLLDELFEAVDRDGALIVGDKGERVHPAAIEARQQRIALHRSS
jgi:hypothetical protein